MIAPAYLQLTLLLLLASVLSGCTEQQEGSGVDANTIRVALLPDQNRETVIAKHELLFKHLEKETGKKFELVVPIDYAATLTLFVENAVDMAYFGGVTFVKAGLQTSTIPLVSRDIDGEFTSVILVNSSINLKELEDLKGKSFSFGSKLSTSGHLMPRYFFENRSITAESYFSRVVYSGAHDKTALMVSNGEVDAGVVNANIVDIMFRDGRLQQSKVKIIWRSPKYQDYVWAIQSGIDEKIRNRIRDAFLLLNSENETGQQILASLGANYFIPVHDSDFEILKNIIVKQTFNR